MTTCKTPASTTIPITEVDSTIRVRPFTQIKEREFSERMLPKLCIKCAQPAEHGREWLLLGPLPKPAQWLLKLIPILVVGFFVALVVALLVAPEAAAAVVGLGGPLGLILGLLVARGVFRRSRNVLTVYLCPEHLPEFERLVTLRRWAKGLMVAITILVVIVGSQLMIYTWFGRRSVSLLLQVAVFGGVPGLLAAGIAGYRLAVARVTKYLGLDAHLSGDETKLSITCLNSRFAANIAKVHATPSGSLGSRAPQPVPSNASHGLPTADPGREIRRDPSQN